jgi:hypothetical protein
MTRAQLLFGVVGATLLALGGSAVSQVELPAGPNRDIVYRKCASCHDLQNLVDTKGLSRENWNGTIDDMVTYGMTITPDEREQILQYLAAYLPPSGR